MEYDFHAITRAMPFLIDGMGVTLKLTALAVTMGILWGTALTVMRLSPSRLLSEVAPVV